MSTQTTLKILLVDDHPLIRAGMARIVEEEEDLSVCGEAESSEQAKNLLDETHPDFALVDISLHESNGIDLVRHINQYYPRIHCLIVSMHEEPVYIQQAFNAGAKGYLLKRESVQNLIHAIRVIQQGESFISECLTSSILGIMRSEDPVSCEAPQNILASREFEIFELLGKGLSRKEIAGQLQISQKTVDTHIDRIKQKLKVESSTKLTYLAIKYFLQ